MIKELNRVALKDSAKRILKANYWKMVIAGLAMAFAIGEFGRSAATYKYDEIPDRLKGIAMITALIGLLIGIVFTMFVLHPLEYGATEFFLRNPDGNGDGTLTDGFRGDNLKQAAFTFLYRDLMIFLFALLLVIPGIIKMYEFYFVAPLTVDHPELSAVEIGDLSKGMTKGRKMELFMLDLSFILWNIASTLTAGLVGIFYYYPYRYQVKALAYRELVLDGADPTRPAKD